MPTLEAWDAIITKLNGNRMEFSTVPKLKRTPVWFSATTDGNKIFIDKAIDHQPSSKISTPRTLTSMFSRRFIHYF